MPRVRASLATGGGECERRLTAATSAYGKASRPRPDSGIDRGVDENTTGTGEASGRLVSITFVEPDLMPRVEASRVSCGRKYAANSVVFRPREDEAGGSADRTVGIASAHGDWVDMPRAPSSCGCINWAVAASCVAPRSEVRGTTQAPSGDKLGLRRSGKEFVRRRSGSGAGRRGPGPAKGSPVTTAWKGVMPCAEEPGSSTS